MKRQIWIALLMILMLACEVTSPQKTVTPTSAPTTLIPALPTATATRAGNDALTTPAPTPARSGKALPAFTVAISQPFTGEITLKAWSKPAAAQADYQLPLSLDKIANREVVEKLTNEQRTFLEQNGFVVVATNETQFDDIRNRVSEYYGQPYYLTTDAAYHALHLTFDELLKALEREQLRPQMIAITQAMLAQVQAYLQQPGGEVLVDDALLSEAYLAVALRLFDPQAELNPDMAARIQPQLDQITAGNGIEPSALIPGFQDDYGAYRPVGHYAGDPDLEAYFRGMTWFGRVNFFLLDPENPSAKPSRLPLILTLALRQAQVQDFAASQEYAHVHEMLTFLIGPTDDSGPVELATLMDQVYGADIAYSGLADEALWTQFLSQLSQLPAPQINSTFVASLSSLPTARTWRFMGQRFALDSYILQNMLYDKVGTQDKKRMVPSGLDVMAALGSQSALAAQEKAGETGYQNYLEQMSILQGAVNQQPENEWLSRFYSGWLYAFLPQVAFKQDPFPGAMRTQAWGYKDLNSALGSWAELKHDTILYVKRPEPAGGGGPPSSPYAPAYVEPNPQVFYRLAYISASISQGLMERGVFPPPSKSFDATLTLERLLPGMEDLGKRFEKLGDIAAAELEGKPPTSMEDMDAIQSCLGIIECDVMFSRHMGRPMDMPPMPVVAAVSGAGEGGVLEAGVGYASRIYVVVPLEGRLQVAQGGVFSYYEFTQPRNDLLTDEAWREKLADEKSPPARPAWTVNFLLPGGEAVDVLQMRIGDMYLMNEVGSKPPLNVREQPSITARIVNALGLNDYFEVIDGPVVADGHTWWKVQKAFMTDEATGWIVQNQAWYDRAYGQ
jgi:hypothetical protein